MQNQCSSKKAATSGADVVKPETVRVRLALVGINYKTSSLAEREPLQLAREELAPVDNILVSTPGVLEAVCICTCNRIEFYLILHNTAAAFEVVAGMYRRHRDLDVNPLREKFYERTETHAARHLMRVGAGLNSMVLGETQIFGQIKQGYSLGCSVKAAGKILHRLFHQAFRTGKHVREQTAIGRGAVSVGGVAVRILKERLAGNTDPAILFVGAGEMISIAAEHFHKSGYRRFSFANRTLQHAEQLAANYGGQALSLADLPQLVGAADVLVSCTGAPAPVITRSVTEKALASATGEDGIIMMDLGVPRDVEREVGELPKVTLLNLDDIYQHLSTNLEERAAAIGPAEDIVEEKLVQFMYWYEAVRLEPVYNGLSEAFEKIRTDELTAAGEACSPENRDMLEQFSIRLARRLLQVTSRRSE